MSGPLPLHLLPDTARVDPSGRLEVGGCDLLELAARFGTPLFVYDEAHLRARCREAVAAFGDGVAYAVKAFLCVAMARLVHEEGLQIDVATGGELHVALAAGVPADRLVLHGNNKSLERAPAGAGGRSWAASWSTASTSSTASSRCSTPRTGSCPRCSCGSRRAWRPTPTSSSAPARTTRSSGSAWRPVTPRTRSSRAPARRHVDLVGVHLHIGSQVFVADFFHQAVEVVAPSSRELGLPELSIGGGLGVAYVEGEEAPTITEWGAAIVSACRDAGIDATVTPNPVGRSPPGRHHPLHRRHDQGHPRRAHLPLRRRRHERQPPARALRVAATRRSCPAPSRPTARPVPSSASTASPATCWCARPRCRPTWPSATSWPRPSPAPTGTRWGRTTTRSSARRWCSSPTATPAWSCAARPTTTCCATTSRLSPNRLRGAVGADPYHGAG